MTTASDTAVTFCATLVDEWVRAGVRHAMVSPGSRSTPMALALLANPSMQVQVFHDERSSAFAALGAGLATGIPSVVLCSSGTAAAHFHAAVIEAHQSNVPMIVCTADRPAHLRGIAAPQTIDQTKLFGGAVRWFHDPGVPDASLSHTWRALGARTVTETLGARPGPVHLNLPFDEPLYGDIGQLPAARGAAWSNRLRGDRLTDSAIEAVVDGMRGRRGVFIAGKGAPAGLSTLAEKLGWPVLADSRARTPRSHVNTVVNFDPILRSTAFTGVHRPEIVVQVGEPPASKVLAQWVKASGCPVQQWSPVEVVTDPQHLVGTSVVGDLEDLCERAGVHLEAGSDRWLAGWASAQAKAKVALDAAVGDSWSEVAVSRLVSQAVPRDAHVVVSSSMPVRDLEWYGGLTDGVEVHSNRGANGIDGVVATGIGVAISTNATTVVMIGDVALLHDASSLTGLPGRGADVRIVVTNNDGGSIFSFLPQATQVTPEQFEVMYGTPHGVDIGALCSAHGVAHVVATDAGMLIEAIQRRGPLVVEARFARSVNVATHDEINAAVIQAVEEGLTA